MKRFQPCFQVFLMIVACASLVGCPQLTPYLVVSPRVIDFGSTGVEESFTIYNAGAGALTYTVEVDTADDIDWLSADVTAGTVISDMQRITLTADRALLVARPGSPYEATVTVATNGGTETLNVYLTMPGTPLLNVVPATLTLGDALDEGTLTIQNLGDDTLTWDITVFDPDNEDATAPVTATPSAGNTAAGGETEITVEVDREGLDVGVYGYTIRVNSDGGIVDVTLNLAVDASAEIGVEPLLLDFGTELSELTFDVYNTGPAGTLLEFTVSTDREDLIFLDPTSGTSVGAITDTGDGSLVGELDRQTVSVLIDRTALTSSIDGGTIFVSAPGLDDVEIAVTVEAAPLTIEGALNRTRPPFLMRFVFLLRDPVGDAIDTTNPAIFTDPDGLRFTIWEDDELIDADETNTFIAGPESLRFDLVMMLDNTGSMYNAEGGGGTVIDQMNEGAKAFIEDLPESWRVAVMEYHERQQANRLLQTFTTDRDPLIEAIDTFSLPEAEHGASEIYDALYDACERLQNEDVGKVAFDDADVRAVVFISDGRDTSSIHTLDEVIAFARDADVRTRFYPIGFGENVNSAPLIKLATETGGHYYRAGDSDRLMELLEQDPDALGADPPGVIATDLSRQMVLTYVTLFQEGSHTYLIEVDYQDVEGSFEEDAVYSIGGDVRAGQIAMHTSGIQSNGRAEVFVRTEYVPRNINYLRFRFIAPAGLTPTADNIDLLDTSGGLLSGWRLIDEGGGVFSLLTEEDNYLQYGAFGNLMRLSFEGLDPATDSFELGLRVDNSVYVNPPLTKFFQYPGDMLNPDVTLTVGQEASTAPLKRIITVDDDFDPDAPNAWDRDEDGVPDFDDLFPDDPDHS